jgi:UDPglucose--hexose-1-phosphate uridylyltransferase
VALRRDPVSGMRVAIAPVRAERPGAFAAVAPRPVRQTPEECAFCAGHEDRTPPAVLELAGATPWGVRVVPNLYPMLVPPEGACEVVIHAPAHVTLFADLDLAAVERVCEAWALRAAALAADGWASLLCSLNDGPGSGASIDHGHSQLMATAEPPPLIAARLARFAHGCPVCAELTASVQHELTIDEVGGVRLYVPWASAVPYQLRAAPLAHAADGLADPGALAGALRRAARCYLDALGPVPWNAWLHSRPLGGGADAFHWHLEAIPRLGTLAGVELGAGLPICAVDPGAAARVLRDGA